MEKEKERREEEARRLRIRMREAEEKGGVLPTSLPTYNIQEGAHEIEKIWERGA